MLKAGNAYACIFSRVRIKYRIVNDSYYKKKFIFKNRKNISVLSCFFFFYLTYFLPIFSHERAICHHLFPVGSLSKEVREEEGVVDI